MSIGAILLFERTILGTYPDVHFYRITGGSVIWTDRQTSSGDNEMSV